MKEININKKLKVIKLFLSGYTFDEIALELGIAKGSVANIIDAFRDGQLQIVPNGYIDALRELAVDIRKQHTSVKKLQMCVKINQKVVEIYPLLAGNYLHKVFFYFVRIFFFA